MLAARGSWSQICQESHCLVSTPVMGLALLGFSWAHLELLWAHLGLSWAHLDLPNGCRALSRAGAVLGWHCLPVLLSHALPLGESCVHPIPVGLHKPILVGLHKPCPAFCTHPSLWGCRAFVQAEELWCDLNS